MGYHKREIKQGNYKHFSKIKEEFEELCDAHEQGNPVMELVELADLMGAIGAYSFNYYNISIEQLLLMMRANQSAFVDGTRKPKAPVKEDLENENDKKENPETFHIQYSKETRPVKY